MKDELQSKEVFRYISKHPQCTFDRIVFDTGYTRGTVKEVCKEFMEAGILDAGLRARGFYKVTGPLPACDGSEPEQKNRPKRRIQSATGAAPIPHQRLVQYVKKLNEAYEKLRAECAVKDSRIAELERAVQGGAETESLIVHKELMES